MRGAALVKGLSRAVDVSERSARFPWQKGLALLLATC